MILQSVTLQKDVFVSYQTKDEAFLNHVETMLQNIPYPPKIRKYNIKASSDKHWKMSVQKIIEKSYAVIVLIGHSTAKSEAIDWEISEALRQNKKVIGIKISPLKKIVIPKSIKSNDCHIIDLNMEILVKILKGVKNEFR